jgi:hypothetical protein
MASDFRGSGGSTTIGLYLYTAGNWGAGQSLSPLGKRFPIRMELKSIRDWFEFAVSQRSIVAKEIGNAETIRSDGFVANSINFRCPSGSRYAGWLRRRSR